MTTGLDELGFQQRSARGPGGQLDGSFLPSFLQFPVLAFWTSGVHLSGSFSFGPWLEKHFV